MTENKRFTLKYINEQHISANLYDNKTFIGAIGIGEELIVELLNDLSEENEQLKSENKRLTDKLNKTALELVSECISQGKATEISEMSYREFLDYRAKNGKPMELQK